MTFRWYLFFAFTVVINSYCLAQQENKSLQPIQLEDIYGKNTFRMQTDHNFRFSKDGVHYYQTSENGDLLKFRLTDGKIQDTVLKKTQLQQQGANTVSLSRYVWNAQENLLLLHSHRKSIYRFSFTSIPWLYDIARDSLFQLTDQPVSNISFSPTGRRVAYCKGNNIFLYDIDTRKETQITHAPEDGAVKYGSADWVYEETFGVVQAYKWSYDGRYIACYEFDMSRVPVYRFPIYDASSLSEESYAYRYYRPGEPISEVSIHIYDLHTGNLQIGDKPGEMEYYYPRIYWSKDSRSLFVYKMPRDQRSFEIGQIDVRKGSYKRLFTERDERYIDRATFDAFYSFVDGRRFIYMSEKEGWRRLYAYDLKDDKETVLTPFSYDADRLLAVDERKGLLYCSVAEDPRERQVLSIDLSTGDAERLTHDSGWHTWSFNPTSTHYLETFSAINRPPVTTLFSIKGKPVRSLVDNARLRDTLQSFKMSAPHFLQIPNRHGVDLHAWILFPPDYKQDTQYPVLFANYGGPGSQKVTNSWGMVNFWHQYLAQQGIIVVCVDNTGTGFRGAGFKKAIYGRLGIQEIEDQMDAARWLSAQYPTVDPTRIGFWGWSFGGFMASMAITYGAEVFSTAVSVAPVTNWELYQSGYAERHMGLLKSNPEGYASSTPMAYIDRMKGNLLLIHGTADDNVHFRNSAIFSQQLIKAGKQFEQHYYPDKDHAIAGTQTRFHLYQLMTDFLIEKLVRESR
ncbi:prolyl oligopeptidase family serine peptidase [Sphingobacterium sp. SGG-5]|uniref:S9 family peptidase n=1 Tax=Sphingobacterium sp. SGG-5 TaxID=2710881 RepID=UPI0013ECAD4B|nr:S9 family peptidase [Sphingobacterium sp. SGG-5]NGM62172.1 prolyl oligopeptidase family serine peptidase [Sphingobacterium sp. SGG-5]